MSRISSKNQLTIPVSVLREVGLGPGDEVVVDPQGPDRIVVRRRAGDPTAALGVFDGLYEEGYLERLRAGERS
jgi:bifunctional DNA-binding transcriptional regulator/antitoxin component of YhaV-PrlF toxin-antitoxin module